MGFLWAGRWVAHLFILVGAPGLCRCHGMNPSPARLITLTNLEPHQY